MVTFKAERKKVAEKATKAFKRKIDTYLRNSLKEWARLICKAAVDNRRHAPGAHNYTGNLIGSIVAAVYENGNFLKAYTSMEVEGREPIHREMTAGGGVHGVYHFREDYDYWQDSNYVPSVDSDQAMAMEHIYDFLAEYQPKSQYFEIVVAYTACYAEFVENEHHTLGFDKTIQNFNSIALRFIRCTEKGMEFYNVPPVK